MCSLARTPKGEQPDLVAAIEQSTHFTERRVGFFFCTYPRKHARARVEQTHITTFSFDPQVHLARGGLADYGLVALTSEALKRRLSGLSALL